MTDIDAIRERYQPITAYVDAEKLVADLESDLADVRVLAAHLKAEYIAALESELARVKGDTPTPKVKTTPKTTPKAKAKAKGTCKAAADGSVVCDCGRVFPTRKQWSGHVRVCPARNAPVEAHHPPRAAFRGAVPGEAVYVAPAPVLVDAEPTPWVCACGRPYTQSIGDPSRCVKCVQEGRY